VFLSVLRVNNPYCSWFAHAAHNFASQKRTDDRRSSHRSPWLTGGVPKIAPSSLFVARTFNFAPGIENCDNNGVDEDNVEDLLVGTARCAVRSSQRDDPTIAGFVRCS
jgi:hypothetical protein